MTTQARLLLSPGAGSRSRQRAARRLARVDGVECRTPRSLEELRAEVRGAVCDGHERLIVAGGDGTLHHAIQDLAGSSCALGIVPLGTGNDLARALGLPTDPTAALSRALGGERRVIDLGRAGTKVFAGVAGLGIDAEVNRWVNRPGRRFHGSWAYLLAALRCFLSYRPPQLDVEFDGGARSSRIMLAAVANSPMFGAGMRIAPQARLDDGLLDLVIVEPAAPWVLLSLVARVFRGTHVRSRAVHVSRIPRVVLRPDRELTLTADGEPLMAIGPEGRIIEAWPRALDVIV